MSDESARAALRARQGAGARYDASAAPAEALLTARRGTSYFARKLNELPDGALDGPSRCEGWSRRHLVAHMGYRARALARLVEAVRTGQGASKADTLEVEVAQGKTLQARALRSLFHHASIHLDVEWRDLTDADWDNCVSLGDGREVALSDTPLLWAREVWRGAVDLGNGGRAADLPKGL